MAYNPPSYGGYERAKNDTQYKYTQDATTNAYSRFISQQRGKRNLGDMQNNYKQSFPEQTAQFGQRGISAGGINSGIMNNSMNRFVGNYAQQQGRATQDPVAAPGPGAAPTERAEPDRDTAWSSRGVVP